MNMQRYIVPLVVSAKWDIHVQGLVKLADFGVAAKLGELEEANNSLRLSVVGTPYWMAPEVIEMTSVTAAADIWSVACLSIELLTGQAPYYDLQPMSALFRIVQDEHPPLPEDISPGMHNMLLQCFNKDPQKRPDARTLLRHPWIQHNRQTLRTSWSRTQGLYATHPICSSCMLTSLLTLCRQTWCSSWSCMHARSICHPRSASILHLCHMC